MPVMYAEKMLSHTFFIIEKELLCDYLYCMLHGSLQYSAGLQLRH